MGNRLIISDHHFGQDSIYRFQDELGNRIRPWATSSAEADEIMIDAHNARVHRKDTCYFLGDIAIRRQSLALLARMNGRKILIRGNHDIFKLKEYTPYFEDIRGSWKIDRLVLQHQPVHPGSIPHWCRANIHGHLHHRRVMLQQPDGTEIEDPRYFNASIECIGLAPVSVEDIQGRLA